MSAAPVTAPRPLARGNRAARLLPALAAMALAVLPAGAAPAATLPDYQHSQWTFESGAPPRISSMAQTTDGWLWLATEDGLYRFDGIRFERVPLPAGGRLTRNRIGGLHADERGNLWISDFMGGLSVLRRDGRFEEVPGTGDDPLLAFGSLAFDRDASIWASGRGGIHHYRGGRWQTVEQGVEWTGSVGSSMLLDGDGRLWAANDTAVWLLDRARGRFDRVASGGGSLLLSPDGRVWAARNGQVALVGNSTHARPTRLNHSDSRVGGQFDASGTLWTLHCPAGVCQPAALARTDPLLAPGRKPGERIGEASPLSGADARAILGDREGNVWFATENGLDRFRPNRLLRSGLPGTGSDYSVATDAQGRTWAANIRTGTLWQLDASQEPTAVPAPFVSVVATGRHGALLLAGKRAIERRGSDGTEQIPLPPGPDGKPADLHVVGMLDDGKVLWIAARETGLLGWVGGKWLPRSVFNLPQRIFVSAAGGRGQLWLGGGDGSLTLYDDGKLTRYDASAVGLASGIFPRSDVSISGEHGLAVLRGGRLHLLRADEPDVLRNVSGMVETSNGDRWLNGARGVVHVRRDDWQASAADPSRPLRYELFDALDGYPGQAELERRLPSAIASADGRLWFIGTGGVVRMETGALRPNHAAPSVGITRVNARRLQFPAGPALELPPGSQRFSIEYAAPVLGRPDRVRFQYRLDGVDSGWQEAGNARTASYTNVAPGTYRFHVRAINGDGVASADEAAMTLTVVPTFVQSAWFKALCLAALGALGALLYRWRVRYLTARLTERLQVRTAERERIARTLHDSFLQTVHGVMLHLDAVVTTMPEEDGARQKLERVLQSANNAIGEGRGQLQDLRASGAGAVDEIVADAIEHLQETHGGIAVELVVSGERRALRAPVAEEVCDIAREALRNAFAHSGAQRIDVRLAYGRRAFILTILDNGKGIEDAVLRGGRSGHWGLPGMRERAAQLGATLDIASAPGSGTQVRLAVPAAGAYAHEQAARQQAQQAIAAQG